MLQFYGCLPTCPTSIADIPAAVTLHLCHAVVARQVVCRANWGLEFAQVPQLQTAICNANLQHNLSAIRRKGGAGWQLGARVAAIFPASRRARRTFAARQQVLAIQREAHARDVAARRVRIPHHLPCITSHDSAVSADINTSTSLHKSTSRMQLAHTQPPACVFFAHLALRRRSTSACRKAPAAAWAPAPGQSPQTGQTCLQEAESSD